MGSSALLGTVRIPAAVRRHPKVPAGWNVAARRSVTRRCYRAGAGCEGTRPSCRARVGGLGAVGGAELAQDVGHVHFDRVERHHQVVGDALVGPARGEQPQHLQFAAGQRLGQARRRGGVAPSLRRSSVPTCHSTSRAAAPSARPGCALPWADAGGVRGFRGGFHRTQGGGHVGPQPVPPGGDDLSGPVWRLRGGCPHVAGAGSVGEALPDPAAAAGERVDPVPPRRGRAGGVTAVIQDHPREREAGPPR